MGPKLRDRIPYALLLGASGALVFWQLGATGFIHSDESIHAISAVEILRTGRWALPAVDGDALFLKAPLATWPLAASFGAFGISEWSARLFAAVCAVLAVMTTAALAGRAFGSAWLGALAGLVLLANPGFLYIHCARFGEPDAPAIFFFCLALWSFWRACETASGRRLALAAAAAGLAAMAKSLAMGLLPLATLGLCLPLVAGLGRFRLRQWGWAGLAFAAVVLPWHALAYARHGPGFIDTYLFHQTIARMEAPAEPAFEWGWSWLQVPVAFHAFAPFAALGALFLFAGGEARQRRAAWLYVSWVVVVGAAVAAVETRLAWYVLPAYPALASLAAGGLAASLRVRRWTWVWPPLIASFALAVGWTLDPAFDPFAAKAQRAATHLALVERFRSLGPTLAALAVLLALLAVAAERYRGFPRTRGARRGIVALVLSAMLAASFVDVLRPLRLAPQRSAVARLADRLGPARDGLRAVYHGSVLPPATDRIYLEAAHFGGGASLRLLCDAPQALLSEARRPETGRLLLAADSWAALRASLEADWAVRDAVPLSRTRAGALSGWLVVLEPHARARAEQEALRAELAALLRSAAPLAQRRAAAVRLGIAGGAAARSEVLGFLEREGRPVLLDALDAFAALADAGVLPDLVAVSERVAHTPRERLRLLALGAQLGEPSAIAALQQALAQRPDDLGRHPEALPALFGADFPGTARRLAASSLREARRVQIAFATAGKRALLRHTPQLLDDAAVDVRRFAAQLYSRSDARLVWFSDGERLRIRAWLERAAAEDPDSIVRAEAQSALRTLHPGIWTPWIPQTTRRGGAEAPRGRGAQ